MAESEPTDWHDQRRFEQLRTTTAVAEPHTNLRDRFFCSTFLMIAGQQILLFGGVCFALGCNVSVKKLGIESRTKTIFNAVTRSAGKHTD